MNSQEEAFFSDLLKQFRTRKRLTQKQLARQIGVSRETISWWERGEYKPENTTMLHELTRILDLDEDEKRLLFEAYSGTASMLPLHNLPSRRNPYFTGREDLLRLLHENMKVGKSVALTQAISGLGGIGKTQMALEYAYRHYRESYHDVLWASADSFEMLVASYMELARCLRLRERSELNQNKVLKAVIRWLAEHKHWLLILDNIEDLGLITKFVPTSDLQGMVLLTTRQRVTEPVAQALELDVLSEKDGASLLLKRAKRLTIDSLQNNASPKELTLAQDITCLLDGLPLALDQAGAYILEKGCSLTAYRNLYQQRQSYFLHRRGSISTKIGSEHPQSVAMTFELIFEEVQRRNEGAIELLKLFAFLAPNDIAEEIVTEGSAHLGPILQYVGKDGILFNDALEVLNTFSLIRRNPAASTFSLHRLVQAVLQDTMGEQEHMQWMKRAVGALDAVFLEPIDRKQWEQCERLLPHVLTIGIRVPSRLESLELASLLRKTAIYLFEHARYNESELLYKRSLHIWEQASGLEHPDVGKLLSGLANVYFRQGKYEEAELLYKRSLHIWEQASGSDHPNVARSLERLATLYSEQGRYEEAEPFYQQVLHIWEQAYGPEGLWIAHPLNGLAALYSEQGKYEEAEPLFRRSLHIREQALGAQHLSVASPLNNLAELYRIQGKYEEAEPLFRRSLHIWEEASGPEHPDVAYSLDGLATLYREQGKYKEAEPLYKRTLHIWEQAYGPVHSMVAHVLNGLAALYSEQGKYEEAEPLFLRALTIRHSQGGSRHPETAEALYGLAHLYEQKKQNEEALTLYEQALSIQEQQLGPQHPQTVDTRTRYEHILLLRGQAGEASFENDSS